MTVETILYELENIAASIAEQSQSLFQKERGEAAESLLERGLDSLDFVDYLLAIESKYGFRVAEKDIGDHHLVSTANMAAYLYSRLSKNRA